MVLEELLHHRDGLGAGSTLLAQLRRPSAAGVQHVPPGNLARDPALARVVVSEPLNADVPQRLVVLDEEPLGHRDPQGCHDEVPAKEVASRKGAGRRDDRSVMLLQAAVKRARVDHVGLPLASARRDRLPHVDRPMRLGGSDRGVLRQRPGIEECVDPCALKRASGDRRERPGPPRHQLPDAVLGEVRVVERVVRLRWHPELPASAGCCRRPPTRAPSAQRCPAGALPRTMLRRTPSGRGRSGAGQLPAP